ncbi:hypothetical protein DFAR_1800005 [Desulfarculales bacterium]
MLARLVLLTSLLLGVCACVGTVVTPPVIYPFGQPLLSAAETAGQSGCGGLFWQG